MKTGRLANIYRLGVKELWGLLRDPMMMILILYAFTGAVYIAGAAAPETLHNAPIAIINEDHSPLSRRIVSAFYPPYFREPELVTPAEADRGMDAGLYTFTFAETGKVVNVKKGQFMAGSGMRFAVEKIQSCGNPNVILTDRGNSFGYSDLVVDFRNIPEMQSFGVPVVMDCTHSLQQPNQASGVTGGRPALIATIAKAAIATGADGLFIETHPTPATAKSDGANMLPLDRLEALLERLTRVREAVR